MATKRTLDYLIVSISSDMSPSADGFSRMV